MCWARVTLAFPESSEIRTKEHCLNLGIRNQTKGGSSGSAAPSGIRLGGCWMVSEGHAVFWSPGLFVQCGHCPGNPTGIPTYFFFPYQPQTLGRPDLTLLLHDLTLPSLDLVPYCLWSLACCLWVGTPGLPLPDSTREEIMTALGKLSLGHTGPM